jgi:S1-C subfamily serine protease
VTAADWLALALVAVSAVLGYARGLISSVLSAAGLIVGAMLGARIAPHLLSGGSTSPYTPIAALVGAALLAVVLEAMGMAAGMVVRRRLGSLRPLDSVGGVVAGGVAGLVLVWMLGTVALFLPGQTALRRSAQRSAVLRQLNDIVPPRSLLNLLARIDPFPSIAGPGAGVAPPDARLVHFPGVRRAQESVVRVLGTACGIGVSGSGWVVRPGLVVTAAHVVAGEHDTTVELPDSSLHSARAVAFDVRNDVAVLAVDDLNGVRPLPLAAPEVGKPVAILGYPENAPLTATPGRIGRTVTVLSEDAYGHGPVTREITSLRGRVRHGNSGGPAVDASGAVQTTVFAARIGSDSGYGIPSEIVRRDVNSASGPVSTGHCVG